MFHAVSENLTGCLDCQQALDTLRTPSRPEPERRLLAISSGGGHWVELLRLRPAFEGFKVTYATVGEGYRQSVDGADFRIVPNANRSEISSVVTAAVRILLLVLAVRPTVVVSTGAAPGYLAIFFGRLIGAQTIWIDSIANAEELSLSGQLAGNLADLWLTQWPHLSRVGGPEYRGTIL